MSDEAVPMAVVSDQLDGMAVSPPDTPSAWTLRVAGFDRDPVVETLDVVRGANRQTA